MQKNTWAVYRDLFRSNVNFRWLFWARTISLFGDWFHLLAVLALLRQVGVHSASAFGWVLILKSLPSALVAPVAGMMADRWSRRRIMMSSDILRAIWVAGMFLQMVWPSLIVLYILIALGSATAAFFEPARSALLPDIVAEEDLTAANALGAATWSAMLTLGSAAGGLWTAYLGWQAALCVDALSFLLSFLCLLRVQEPTLMPKSSSSTTTGWVAWLGLRDMASGFSYMAKRPRIWSLTLVKAGWLLALPSPLLLAMLGERVYAVASMPILAVTALYVARGLGTGTGPFIARELSQNQPARMEKMIFWGFLCGAVFYALLPFAGGLWGAVVCVLLAHLGGATIWVFSTIRLQQSVPTQWRGRVFASELSAFTCTSFVSTWVVSTLLDRAQMRPFTLIGIAAGAMLIITALWGIRGVYLGWADTLSTPSDVRMECEE